MTDKELQKALNKRFPGFEGLSRTLLLALKQAAEGKGQARHGNSMPWASQPIHRIPQLLGDFGQGFLLGQALKKTVEGGKMLARRQRAKAGREFLGAIVYLAAAYEDIDE